MAKKNVKKVVRVAPPEHVFWLCNGQTLKNLEELEKALETIDNGVFSYHVNAEKNDFANWIKDIFMDIELAEKLKGVMDKEKYLEIIKVKIKAPVQKKKTKTAKKKKK
jgi:hypothetical protein